MCRSELDPDIGRPPHAHRPPLNEFLVIPRITFMTILKVPGWDRSGYMHQNSIKGQA